MADCLTPAMINCLRAARRALTLWHVRGGWIAQPGGTLMDGPFYRDATVRSLARKRLLSIRYDTARITTEGQAALARILAPEDFPE